MNTLACLNGQIMLADEARVPISDRGFLFGDAVYEVFRLTRGRLWLEDSHLARLQRSLAEMLFEAVDLGRLLERIGQTVRASEVVEGTVYVQITRGVAPRKHAFPRPEVEPTELIVVRPYDDATTSNLRVSGVSAISLLDERWGRCDVKSTNLLANVIANERRERRTDRSERVPNSQRRTSAASPPIASAGPNGNLSRSRSTALCCMRSNACRPSRHNWPALVALSRTFPE